MKTQIYITLTFFLKKPKNTTFFNSLLNIFYSNRCIIPAINCLIYLQNQKS